MQQIREIVRRLSLSSYKILVLSVKKPGDVEAMTYVNMIELKKVNDIWVVSSKQNFIYRIQYNVLG